MSRGSIGCFIASPGRSSLIRTLASVRMQGLQQGDDIIVVGDGFNQNAKDIVDYFGPPFRYVATKQTRDWGHSQSNYGIQNVGGDWVIAQDDDDIFLPRAFDEIRDTAAELDSPRPIIGRVMTPYLGILWTAPNTEPLDGHCIVVPNDKKKIGYFGLEYAGDQKWIQSCLAPYDKWVWADRIWALTRPKWTLWPTLTQPTTWNFAREFEGQSILQLEMYWGFGQWSARVITLQDDATLDEIEEVVQFAAYAAQGHDIRIHDNLNPLVERACQRSGFKRVQFDWQFTWPPHTFEPKDE